VKLRCVFLLAVATLAAQTLSPADLNRVQVGQPAPNFTLEAADGHKVSLSDYRGKRVVLVFYRGQW
jgi:cytochrome oxidase Cu insertion factor (SCO1/SenC/PrrC family)